MSEHKPLVSVCIPVYNGAAYIAETVRSVQMQKGPDLQILVQDNASTDATLDILAELAAQDSRVKVYKSDITIGMADNWNKAIARADTDYVMLLSADDMLAQGFLKRCLQVITSTGADAATTNHFWLRKASLKKKLTLMREGIYSDFALKTLLFNPFSINFTVFNRRSLLNICGTNGEVFSSRLLSCDYDLWYRIAFSGQRVYYSSEALGLYRVHDNNLSGNLLKMTRHAALVVLHYAGRLKKRWPVLYRLSIARFIYRVLREGLRGAGLDKRLLRVLTGELF